MTSCPRRVLQVIGAMDRAGAETLVMNLYRKIDRDLIQFDFLVNETRECDFDSEILGLGGSIYRIPRYRIANYFNYRKACRTFFAEHPYKVVHGHIGLPASIYLDEANRIGAYTIAHSHSSLSLRNPADVAFQICSYSTRFNADYFLGCSQEAGISRFGKQVVQGDRFSILNNGIDAQRGRFDSNRRKSYRESLGLSKDTPAFGCVARFAPVKNHSFLLKTFSAILERMPDAALLLAGVGELEPEMKRLAESLGISEHVHFLGLISDIPTLLDAIDVFLFPSIIEGLGVAVIEAQTSGARCLVSSAIPKLANVSGSLLYKSLSDGFEAWANTAIDLFNHPFECREREADHTISAGFDISTSADWITDFYLSAFEKTSRC